MNISVNYDVWILQRDNNSVSKILNMLLATSTIDFFESKLHFMSVLFAYASNVTVRVARGFRTAGTAISYSGVFDVYTSVLTIPPTLRNIHSISNKHPRQFYL